MLVQYNGISVTWPVLVHYSIVVKPCRDQSKSVWDALGRGHLEDGGDGDGLIVAKVAFIAVKAVQARPYYIESTPVSNFDFEKGMTVLST